jgi:ketosteroid isomerase-like protein
MTNMTSDASIRAITEARANVVNAGDVDAMVADLANDVVSYDAVDPLRRRRHTSVLPLDDIGRRRIRWKNLSVQVAVDGDVARQCSGRR